MRLRIITWLTRPIGPWPTDAERITTLGSAILFWLGRLPGLDASVRTDGTVCLFRVRR
jgi:hypothetical protein